MSGCVSGPSETTPKETTENETPAAPTQCTPDWNCSAWGLCLSVDTWNYSSGEWYTESFQNRNCSDLNNCGWTAPEQQDCISSAVRYENYIKTTSIIYISEGVAQILANEFATNRNEFAFCMDGEPYSIDNKSYNDGFLINKLERATSNYSTPLEIATQKCNFGVGLLHSHPSSAELCWLSAGDIDVATWEGFPLFAVACSRGKYTFYKLGGLATPIEVRVLEKKCTTVSGVESCIETFKRV